MANLFNSQSHYESKIIQNGQTVKDVVIDNINKNGNIVELVNDKLRHKRFLYSNNRTNKFRKNILNSVFANARMPNFYDYSKPIKIRSRKIGKKYSRKSKKNRVLEKDKIKYMVIV
jgi:hypothetical protein